MSLVGSRVALTQRCTIDRDANAATTGAWGTPSSPDWQPHLTDVPCRAWASSGRENVADGTTVTPVEDARVIVPLGTDVTDADRIASVTFRGGTAQDGPLGIRAVLARSSYLELVLVKV
jgi:hypothetical protein